MRDDFLHHLLAPARLTHVVDIGANPIDGDPPYRAMISAGLGLLTGFEPQADALAALQASARPHEHYLPHAIGDGHRHRLHLCRYSGWTSFLVPDRAALDVFSQFKDNATIERSEEVATVRLDDLHLRAPIDLLKIDIQGSELGVFENARVCLRETVAIQTELSFICLYEKQPGLGAIDHELRQQGFVPYCIVENKVCRISPEFIGRPYPGKAAQLVEADLLYVRDYVRHPQLSDEQLKQLCLVMHHCYQGYDLALWCIRRLSERGALRSGAADAYVDGVDRLECR